jgi:transposase InsO family protein
MIEVLLPPVESAQYTSGDFQKWCAATGVTQSMGAVGVC